MNAEWMMQGGAGANAKVTGEVVDQHLVAEYCSITDIVSLGPCLKQFIEAKVRRIRFQGVSSTYNCGR